MTDDDLTMQLEAIIAPLIDPSDSAHDLHHLRRVRDASLAIAAEGPARTDILIAAAYLHDIVSLPKDAPNRAQASRLAATAAAPVLAGLEFSEGDIAATCHVIEAHSYSAGIPAQSLEAKIMQDADRLDALGAIGMLRWMSVGAQMGAVAFDPVDPFATNRPLDDKHFSLDHMATKLLRIEAQMQTRAGRGMAHKRTQVMRQFLVALSGELGAECGW